MNKLIKTLTALGIALAFSVTTVKAVADTVTISDLAEYTRTDNFMLSYSALSSSISSVQFCYKKDGGTYATFGPVLTTASGQVQVTGSQISEQAKYFFKVVLNGSGCSGGTQDETSVTYDISGPSPVQNYYKEQVGPGFYRLHWKNPGDSDFSRVFIYRSDSTNFDADGSHKVAEIGGAPDADMTWDNNGLDTSKIYFYALRAVDKAGNPATIVADPEVGATVTTGTVVEGAGEASGGTSGTASTVSSSGTTGQVLGEESGAGETGQMEGMEGSEAGELGMPTAEQGGLMGFLTSSGVKMALRIILAVVIFYVLYRVFFRRKRPQDEV